MKAVVVVATVSLFACAPCAIAQEKGGAVAIDAVEAIVTVTDVDREARTVTVVGPEGRMATINVPPEAQNLDQVQPGSRFRVRYVESVAVAVRKGGAATSSAGGTVMLAPKGDIPGGMVVNIRQISGTVETIDYGNRLVSVRGPEGNVLAFTVDDAVRGLEQIQANDVISVEYTESLAMRMIKE